MTSAFNLRSRVSRNQVYPAGSIMAQPMQLLTAAVKSALNSFLQEICPNLGGDEGRIYGQKRGRSEIGKFSMDEKVFQSLQVNLDIPELEDDEQV